MKHNKKTFWTLDRHHAAGFTLVELIVVIAILAILAGVGIPVYSGYITKANKQADMTLVSEVANALQLHYYSDPTNAASGYVVLSTTVASADDAGVGATAMQKVFGDNWQTAAVLKYDKWTNDGLLAYVLENADSAPLIAGSTFLTTATPDGLMNAVTNLTDAATEVIQNYAQKGGDVEGKLTTLVGEEFVTKLNDIVDSDDPDYETVISNMLVGHFAEKLNQSSLENAMADDLTGMMLMYAEVYAYCETIGDTQTMSALNEFLAGTDDMDNLSVAGLNMCLTEKAPDGFIDGFLAFAGTDEEPGQGAKDIQAALEIMGAVSFVADTYTDKESLSNADLYASSSVAEQLDNYINAVKAVANPNLNTTALNNLGDNSIVIFVAEDGSVSVVPDAAYLAG